MHTFRAAARSLTLPNKKMTAFLRDVVIGQVSFFRNRKIKLSHGFLLESDPWNLYLSPEY